MATSFQRTGLTSWGAPLTVCTSGAAVPERRSMTSCAFSNQASRVTFSSYMTHSFAVLHDPVKKLPVRCQEKGHVHLRLLLAVSKGRLDVPCAPAAPSRAAITLLPSQLTEQLWQAECLHLLHSCHMWTISSGQRHLLLDKDAGSVCCTAATIFICRVW